ncbi:16821_t:CDS:1, partial [Gigaspora rosea]
VVMSNDPNWTLDVKIQLEKCPKITNGCWIGCWIGHPIKGIISDQSEEYIS